MNRDTTGELDKIYIEIIKEMAEYSTINKAFKLGSANTGKFFYDLLIKIEENGSKEIQIKDLKCIIEKAMSDDELIHEYFNKLMK
ncbi:hypothetical protein CS562_14185 [Paenibacillus sp. LK1]|nr:hypothetical protein CS562_14185 [Paenibacillus sp. LK1]